MTDTIESLVNKLASTHGAKVDYALLRLPSGTVIELQPGVAIAEDARAELNEMLTLPAGWVPKFVGVVAPLSLTDFDYFAGKL